MRIAVDARSLSTRPTGVGHYLLAAVNTWAALRPQVHFLLLSHKPMHSAASACLAKMSNVEFIVCPGKILPQNGLIWLLTRFDVIARRLNADALWGAAGVLPPRQLRRLPALLTVHDLVYRDLPWTMAMRSRLVYSMFAGNAIKTAEWVWAVSAFTSRSIECHYPLRKASKVTVGSGLNPIRLTNAPSSQELVLLRQQYQIHERTLLFVGTLEPRKNLGFLLKLMPRLVRHGFNLLIVGCAGWGKTEVAQIVQSPGFPSEAIQFCDYVSDVDLQGLYRCVAFFVSCSLLEGFGLPHLEAMAAGCPVIAPKNSAVIEVVGSGGVLIAGWNTDDWIHEILSAYSRLRTLKSAASQAALQHTISNACIEVDTQFLSAIKPFAA